MSDLLSRKIRFSMGMNKVPKATDGIVMKTKNKTTYSFKKGEKLHLDDIYDIQGVDGGEWWKPTDDSGDEIVITENINIVIVAEVG